MKKIIQKNLTVSTLASLVLLPVMSFVMATTVSAEQFEQMTAQMDPGQTSANVTRLQTFMSANPSIYPEGRITGFFGMLTKSAVMRFQALYGFDQVGRVGPMTLAKLNSLIATGGWRMTDTVGPSLYNVSTNKGTNSITFTLNTNENTGVRIVYNTSPLMFNEGDINSNGFSAIGGYTANSSTGMGTSHTVTAPNLIANTTYYYTIIATDATGNVSVWGPNNALRTNQ